MLLDACTLPPELATFVTKASPFLAMGDPPADELVASLFGPGETRARRAVTQALRGGIDSVAHPSAPLRAYFQALDDVPIWVDPARLDRGGRAFMGASVLGIYVLTGYSLPLSYASPDGNKPLILSGQLTRRATRRLLETAGYVSAVCEQGGLLGGSGYQATARVRLMHAHMRRLLLDSGRWDAARWGQPVNQLYMAATSSLFGPVMVDGLRCLGFHYGEKERADIVHLWRYAGHLMGVDPRLNAATEQEGLRTISLIQATLRPPDDDARALVAALMGAWESVTAHLLPVAAGHRPPHRRPSLVGANRRAVEAIGRYLLGDTHADSLGLAKGGRAIVCALRLLVPAASWARRLAPGHSATLGDGVWRRLVSVGLGGTAPRFEAPSALPPAH